MNNVVTLNDFNTKFSKLSQQNKKYIIAIQQALLYAQETENAEKKDKDKNFTKK